MDVRKTFENFDSVKLREEENSFQNLPVIFLFLVQNRTSLV